MVEPDLDVFDGVQSYKSIAVSNKILCLSYIFALSQNLIPRDAEL